MANLTAGNFTTFFTELWGHPPFPWQERLCTEVMNAGRFPSVVDLPTGSGKTSLIDIAVFALAAQPPQFARRIAFVIDRRVVVDQTSERADSIAERLTEPPGPMCRSVADALAALSPAGTPLVVARLRGGIPLDDGWAQWPDQPAVIVSTVDQVGSRLLYRGYGVSRRMWPVHAGLVGNDCTLLLDEVHLSAAFAETADALFGHDRTVRELPRRGQVVQLSATPIGTVADRFTLTSDELADQGSELGRRVNAVKWARLRLLGKGRTQPVVEFPKQIAKLLDQLPDDVSAIGVVVNRVATARAIAHRLADAGEQVHLVTGRMRPIDREAVITEVQRVADPEREPDEASSRTIVVATQTIEVGADLSFDAMITEVAPLDSLRQRFGRLDRRGSLAARGTPAEAIIIAVPESVKAGTDDPVYGTSSAATWQALATAFGDDAFDIGPTSAALGDLPGDLAAPRPHAPVLLDPHVDLLVQTAPAPWVTPPIEMYLHGVPEPGEEARAADVSVVWRTDFDVDDPDRCRDSLELLRPRAGEAMAVPVHAARAWLKRTEVPDVADAPQRTESTERRGRPGQPRGRHSLRWRGRGDIERVQPGDIAPGDTIVVPADYGGIAGANWDPASTEPVRDIAHEAAAEAGRPALRLHGLHVDEESSRVAPTEAEVNRWLGGVELADSPVVPPTPWRLASYGSGVDVTWVLLPARQVTALADLDGSDAANSFTGVLPSLSSHLDGVGQIAGEMAARLGLGDGLVEDMRRAGRAHDLGKVDRRFQQMLHGDPIRAAMAPEPVAKGRSAGRSGRKFGYPRGMRHEFASLALLEAEQSFVNASNDPDLVRHLVITHHGCARPIPHAVADPEPEQLAADVFGHEFRASSEPPADVTGPENIERFWRLVDRYGTHGLAWLEAIFRLADHRRSQLESERQDPGGSP